MGNVYKGLGYRDAYGEQPRRMSPKDNVILQKQVEGLI
jgi:hypothetical protein